MILLERVREKTNCQHSLRFREKEGKVTAYHERRRRQVSTTLEGDVGWLTVLMEWIEGCHANAG